MPFKYPTPLARLEANCAKIPIAGCWLWLGAVSRNRDGTEYGKLSIRRSRGSRKGRKGSLVTVAAHRYAVAASRQLPLWRIRTVLHKCDVSLCCNPAHLRASTQRANVRDAVAKGRHSNGRKHAADPF